MPNNAWNSIYQKEIRKGLRYKYYNILKPHEDLGRFEKELSTRGFLRVLDLGCGAGRNLFPLVDSGFEVIGFDNSRSGLDVIRSKIKKDSGKYKKTDSGRYKNKDYSRCKIQLKTGDVFSRLPFHDESFDAVMSIQVLNHSTEKKIIGAISEIERILKRGGLVFITLPGMYVNGKMRYYYNHDSREIGPRTRVPTKGEEKGLPHFYYNKEIILRHFRGFSMLEFWKDKKDYYCFIAEKK